MYAVTTVMSSMHSCLVVHGEYCFLDVTDHIWFLQSSQGLRVSAEKVGFLKIFFNIKTQTKGPTHAKQVWKSERLPVNFW